MCEEAPVCQCKVFSVVYQEDEFTKNHLCNPQCSRHYKDGPTKPHQNIYTVKILIEFGSQIEAESLVHAGGNRSLVLIEAGT